MSKRPERQLREEANAARVDKAHWQKQLARADSVTARRTYARAVARSQARIDKAEGKK